MTYKLEALQELLAAIKAGYPSPFESVKRIDQFTQTVINEVQLAYNGSLDAAKALHDAVSDDYLFLVGVNWVEVWLPFGGDIHKYHARNDIPARAWLMAILSALIAEETAHD